MGLAIDGNVVHGIAIAGNAFAPASKESLIGKKVSGLLNAQATVLSYTSTSFTWMETIYQGRSGVAGYGDTGTIIAEFNYQPFSPHVAVKCDSGNIASDSSNICWFSLEDLTVED